MKHPFYSIINNPESKKIACIGDIMIDYFVEGEVSRISPEAPVPVLLRKRSSEVLGGSGNVIRNLNSLGVQVEVCSVIGKDTVGEKLKFLLTQLSNVKSTLIESIERPTTHKTRFMSQGHQLLRVDEETSGGISLALENEIVSFLESKIKELSGIILSDYSKGVLTPSLIRKLIALAQKNKVFTAVDPKGNDYSVYAGADVLTPNMKELSAAVGETLHTDEEVIEGAQKLINLHQLNAVLVTRSEKGMTLVEKSGKIVHIPTEAQEVFDVSGAGYTVISSLTAAYAACKDLELAARFSNTAAGIVVGKIGTATVTSAEIMTKITDPSTFEGQDKIMTWEEAHNAGTLWHRKNLKIGFTNGCFDLLHPGHISLLRQAKAHCDRLIVGLNSDASVKRLKGDARPVQDQPARATVLSALQSVDAVVIFEEDTPAEIIQYLKPDVLIKGADYTVDKVVGAEFVQAHGGQVVLASLVDGQSTTNTIKKMNS